MIKQLLEKNTILQIISFVISVLVLISSLFAASKINIYEETNIYIGLLTLLLIFAFTASFLFIVFLLSRVVIDLTKKNKKKF